MSSVYPSFEGSSVQRCLSCGTPLPTHVVKCVNCGTYNPGVQQVAYTDQRQVQWGNAQPQVSMNDGQYSDVPLGQPFIPPAQYPQKQNANYIYPSTTYGGYAQPSLQKKKGPGISFIVGIGLLLVLLIGGALAGYYYYKHHVQNNTRSSTSSSVLATPTAPPLFSDAFTSNNMGWDLTSNQGKFSVKVGRGSLVLEDDQNKLLWETVPNTKFSDFRLDVNASLTRGDPNNGYGVFIRTSNQGGNLGTYYRFELYGDGTYAIFKGSLDANGTPQSDKVQGYMVNSAIAKIGQVNHITLVANGSVMTLIVNGHKIYTYTDDNYKGGSIALFVSNLPELAPGAQATFTNLAIFPVSK
jgi:3-keto-disaccharide hydrolase